MHAFTLYCPVNLLATHVYTGVDFETLAVPVVIDFSPDVQRTPIPVNITEDDILKWFEHFVLTLARPPNAPQYLLGTTIAAVFIVDNEGERDYGP